MLLTRFLAFILAIQVCHSGFATEPRQVDTELLKLLCGGQWMIDEDRNRLVETREEAGIVRARSWMIDNCFKRMIRDDTYRYDAETKKLTATIVWSNGNSWNCDGKWNPDSKTLTWMADTGTNSFSLRFVTPKIVEYVICGQDNKGSLTPYHSEKRYLLAR